MSTPISYQEQSFKVLADFHIHTGTLNMKNLVKSFFYLYNTIFILLYDRVIAPPE